MKDKAYKIKITGLVQGVGFRPFIYRIAKRYKLKGQVENRTDGVYIKVQDTDNNIHNFIETIKNEAPPASCIYSVDLQKTESEDFNDFRILKSKDSSDDITNISPDIAVCNECIEDMKHQDNRIDYPFVNCTNCGPRFTIIQDLPYDREKTTMSPFVMCKDCEKEYKDIKDRRFHAQPVACNNCGPEYELIYKNNVLTDINDIIKKTAELIENGDIVGIKGLGGFHLACDASNEKAVKKLRSAKNRDGKPFAVMFGNMEKLKEYAYVSPEEEKILDSWKRPIVLLKEKKKLAESVSVNFATTGAMLPYMPIHYMLFQKLNIPAIILTSGNMSEEPIIIDNETAKKKLSKICDALLIYNREIYNRTDDSVVVVINDKERIIRRSRGYVPSPVLLNMDVGGILATGAELANCFCIGKGNQAILSQHIGDLKNIETLEFYTETIEKYKKLFRVKPSLIACDMHPDYLSTRYANEQDCKILAVQHHHAHIASCMAEYGLDEQVIGVSFDGTGYGDDSNIWGGEFFVCDLNNYSRYTHFQYMPMPGGDKSAEQPWRMAISYLYKVYGKNIHNLNLPFLKNIKHSDIELILSMIDKKINTPLTSSAGRLFDAVAGITGICPLSSFHAEAPMRLESVADINCSDRYSFDFNNKVSFIPVITEIVKDMKKNVPLPIISSKFHNTIISVIFAVVNKIEKEYNIKKVVLSGGVFQNRYLLERTEKLLTSHDYKVYINSKIQSNDGGIALGQLAIAAKRRMINSL